MREVISLNGTFARTRTRPDRLPRDMLAMFIDTDYVRV